jgi:hypothetical protein
MDNFSNKIVDGNEFLISYYVPVFYTIIHFL